MYPNWIEEDLLINGRTFHYTRTGGQGKPVLVLAHGFSDAGWCWLPVARDLEAEWDVILPDARGHGRSARIQPGETIDRAADLANLVRALGLERPVVGGHSMGANTAAMLGQRFPELARALVLEDPPWFPPEPEGAAPARPNPFRDNLTSFAGKSVDELIAICRKQNPAWPEVELRPWAEAKLRFDLGFFQLPPVPRYHWQDAAAALQCPTLLLTADPARGAIVTPEIAREAAQRNPRIQVEYLAGAGHNIRREAYAGYMKALRAFLARC